MKNSLLKKLYAVTVVSALFIADAEAQIIYTDVKPDAKFSCSNDGCSHQYNFDLNNDGINDFVISVGKYSNPCGHLSVSISKLDLNEVVANNPFSLNAIINGQTLYTTYETLELESVGWFSYCPPKGNRCNCQGPISNGGWLSSVDGYLGLKLIKGGNVYYGWVRLSVSVSSKSASFTVKDYAYNSVPDLSILAGQTSAVVTQVQKNGVINDNIEISIHPLSISQIPKIDGNNIAAMQKTTNEKGENEFTGQFRKGNHATSNVTAKNNNNSAGNTYAARINSCPSPPLVQTNFEGNRGDTYCGRPTVPNCFASECSIAISNSGKIVSVSNDWMNYYNENGTIIFSDTLYHFGHGLIDGRVLYDPKADRFIFSALYGVTDFVSIFQVFGTVVGFSKTNNPVNGWNLYQIPFTNFNDKSTGDYPLIAISENELFMTVTYFTSSSSRSLKHGEIIQMDKTAGYNGSAFINTLKYDASLNGSVKGSPIPVQGGSTTYGPNMFFVMADETGNNSNKYALYEITNTIASGQATLKNYGIFNSDLYYQGSGVSYQPGGLEVFDQSQPNDAYIQNAFYENGIIQFCQNSQVNGKASPYVGRITGIPNNLSCTAKNISSPNLYLSFSSIAYSGNSSTDNSAIVGIEHTGTNMLPGLSAAYVNSNFDISSLATVKDGDDTLNYVWGDYSGICKRYNHPDECWFEGQYGSLTPNKANWIAKLNRPPACEEQTIVSKNPQVEELNTSLVVFPNPLSNSTTILFTVPQPQNALPGGRQVSLKIFDMTGRLVKVLADARFEKGQHQLEWNAAGVTAGMYILQIKAGDYTQTNKLSVIK